MEKLKTSFERNLVARIQKGDLKAFNEIYALYQPLLLAFVNRYTKSKALSEEIVQDVFINIWEKHSNLNEDLSFKSYLFTITKNKITDYFRKNKTENIYRNYIQNFVDESENAVLNNFILKNFNSHIFKIIKKLPDKRKIVFILSKKFDLTREEIAQFMGISENTVKNQLHEAIQFIREQLNSDVVVTLFIAFFASIF